MNVNLNTYQQIINLKNYKSNKNPSKLSFGRAFTSDEMKIYTQKLSEARDLYEITQDKNEPEKKLNNTALILPDFYCPDRTLTSDSTFNFIKLIKNMTGTNVVQCLPRGPVTENNLSPFSSSPFEIGDHLIDINKLGAPDLKSAYENFKALPEDSDIKQQFKTFNEKNPFIERYGILEALKKEHGTDYWPLWKNDLDKNLFNYDDTKEIPKEIKDRQDQLKKDDEVDFYKYRQFIANKQHVETKENLNKEGIKLFGDCLIGFSYRDQWAYKPAFEEGKFIGCNGDDGKFNDWGLPCLDFNKLYDNNGNLGTAGKLLKQKFDVFLSNYDGARIDAGWQLSNPQTNKGSEYLDTKLLAIMEMSIKEQIKNGHNINTEDINIEELGGPSQAVGLTKNKYPHIHITRYASDGWGRPAFYNGKKGRSNHEKTNAGYKLNGFTIGVGCHDDISLITLEKEKRNEQASLLSNDIKTPINNAEDFRNAKFGELFTARNQFFTAPDAIGDERRLNNPAAQTNEEKAKNWTIKAPENYEETYFKNLSQGKGLNVPKSLSMAIRAKMGENEQTKEILSFLDKAGSILRQNGPNTIAEADKLSQENPQALQEKLDSNK